MGRKRNRKKEGKIHTWDLTSEQGRQEFQEHMNESERLGNDIIMESNQARYFHGIEAPQGVNYVAFTAQNVAGPRVLQHPRLGVLVYVVPYKFMRERLQNKTIEQGSASTLH